VKESRKTAAFALVSVALVLAAWAISPRDRSDPRVNERGQPFFAELTDANRATSLEVITYDEQGSMPRPFKVQNRNGRWTIPSQYNYPADGGERLANIAAALIAMKKDDVASELPADQARCQVLDPLDETLPSTKGRGIRIIVNGVNDRTLADVIVGAAVEGRPSYRYARLPGSNRTYVARVEGLDVSTKLQDWIETSLLKVERPEIDQILVRNYSVSPAKNSTDSMDVVPLGKRQECDDRRRDGSSATDTFTMNLLITRLVDLAIQTAAQTAQHDRDGRARSARVARRYRRSGREGIFFGEAASPVRYGGSSSCVGRHLPTRCDWKSSKKQHRPATRRPWPHLFISVGRTPKWTRLPTVRNFSAPGSRRGALVSESWRYAWKGELK
jgi:hypothetical protein